MRFSKNNLDSARTEKYNKYSSRKALPAATQSPTARSAKDYERPLFPLVDEAIQGAIDDPQRLLQQDKKDFALYYKDFKRILKHEQR